MVESVFTYISIDLCVDDIVNHFFDVSSVSLTEKQFNMPCSNHSFDVSSVLKYALQ